MINDVINNVQQKYLPSGSFRGDFATLSLGRIFSQLIPLFVTPLLTRIYTPADFGVYAIFIALVTVISLLSNGRYNLAITLPRKLDKATELLLICIIGVVSVSLFTFIIFFSFRGNILETLALENKSSFVFLVPLGVFIVASIESVYYWLLRRREYKFLSGNFAIQTLVINTLKVVFALLLWGWLGLVLAYILGALLSLVLLVVRFLRTSDFVNTMKEIKLNVLFKTAKKYKEFPLLSMPADAINSFANQLPNMLLNSFFGGDIVGFYSLTQKVLGVPIAFVSSAMTDVYRERASTDYRDKGSCRKIFLATLKNLSLFSIAPFFLLFLFAPTVVPFLLGEQWVEVGGYIRILTPLFLFRFIASPLGSTLYINEKQNILLFWQIGLLLCTVGSFYFGNLIGNEYTSLLLFSISYSIMYIMLLGLGYKFSKKKKS